MKRDLNTDDINAVLEALAGADMMDDMGAFCDPRPLHSASNTFPEPQAIACQSELAFS